MWLFGSDLEVKQTIRKNGYLKQASEMGLRGFQNDYIKTNKAFKKYGKMQWKSLNPRTKKL